MAIDTFQNDKETLITCEAKGEGCLHPDPCFNSDATKRSEPTAITNREGVYSDKFRATVPQLRNIPTHNK